jgi:tRNA-splicing ligase RtcB
VLQKINDWLWELPVSHKSGMRVPGRVYASEAMVQRALDENALEQVANVATLPGVQKFSLAMPDIHWGYGFPIGGCAATNPAEDGVISPGGVGYDINCGVRLMRTNLRQADVSARMKELVAQLFRDVPCGLGKGSDLDLSHTDEKACVREGATWAVARGFGKPEDLDFIEERGCLAGAEPSGITNRALERGAGQVGSLGSGNHFLEVQVVDEIFDEHAAEVMGLSKGSVTAMIHCGSRGFGYQVCDDYLKTMRNAPAKYGISLPDRQLACAPVESPEGQEYLAAMRCAANYAFANRQVLMVKAERAFQHALRISPRELGMELVYDVPHNIAKMERHGGRMLCVHRKGATRAFPPGHESLPARYRGVGQPVLVPGDMGRCSFVLVGTQAAMEQTFGTVCHGAGRMMSRAAAMKHGSMADLRRALDEAGVTFMAHGKGTALEEAPWAYKDVSEVVEVCHQAGLARKVARLRPLGVIKG